ncbi:MAG: hypothetical protein LBS88_03610 [Tannerellaceae bacterium]|jgi:hypothetical protein|nr:hypothetical protein [Tannerellaceae bacterium]
MRTKILIPMMMLSLFCINLSVQAQSDRKYRKTMEKEYKAKVKELKKQKWQISGSSLTLNAAIMKHQRTLDANENSKELIATVSMCQSLNVCRSNALNNALIEYAQGAGSYVRGRIASDMFNNSSAEAPQELDNFYAAYERLVSAEVKGELEFSLALEKKNGAGKSYQAWYIINEDKASKARMRAMRRAAEESRLAQEYAHQISQFVQEGFGEPNSN